MAGTPPHGEGHVCGEVVVESPSLETRRHDGRIPAVCREQLRKPPGSGISSTEHKTKQRRLSRIGLK